MHQLPKINGIYSKFPERCFLKKGNPNWDVETCRENLHNYFNSHPDQMEFYFCAGGPQIAQRVIRFFGVVEPAANVTEEDRVKIEVTSDKTMLHVVMSPWWRNTVRRSLLTALLYSSRAYSEETAKGFNDALNSDDYTSETRAAIDLFLSGHTAIKNKSVSKQGFNGWYSLFTQANFDPSKVLTRIKRKKIEKPAA